jgi:hypothetical protein
MKKMLVCLAALTLSCGTLFAQAHSPKVAHATNPSAIRIPAAEPPAGLATIFTNLGPSNTDLYYSLSGWYVAGTNAPDTTEQWIGLPFTPKANSHVTRVQLALGYISGTNKFIVGVYNDNGSGAPGTPIQQFAMQNAPAFGVCCALVTKVLSGAGIPVAAGKTYWLVASSNNTSAPDFEAAWQFSNLAVAYDPQEGGWSSFQVGDLGAGQPAGAVLGTIP